MKGDYIMVLPQRGILCSFEKNELEPGQAAQCAGRSMGYD